MGTPRKEYDLYKDSPVRYLGYTNEVGEALRGFIGAKMVYVSYGIATLYVMAHAFDKTIKTFKINERSPQRIQRTAFVATDTLIWQMFASVIIPGFTINRICAFTDYLLRNTKLAKSNRMVLVTVTGLASVPFIIKPIDNLCDSVLDETFRKLEP